MKHSAILSSAQLSSAQLSSAQLKPDSVWTSRFRPIGRGVVRAVGIALFSTLIAACGGGGGGGSSGVSVGGIPASEIREAQDAVLADPDNSNDEIAQPMATANVGNFDDGTTEDDGTTPANLVFPVDSVLIRSADGEDYAYLFQQDAVTISGTPGTPAGLTFRFASSPGGTCGATISPGETCTDGDGATITFTNSGGRPMVCSRTGGTTLCSLFNQRTVNGVTTYTIVPSTSGRFSSPTGTLTGGSGTPGTPDRTLPAIVQVWGFETGDADVAANVASLAFIADSTNSGITVKGAHSLVDWRDPDNGETSTYETDAYFFEADYSGFGIWLEDSEEFFSADSYDVGDSDSAITGISNSFILPYGLATPSAALQALTGTAQYTGRAVGFYFRDYTVGGDVDAADRFLVGGAVMLNANFGAGTITGNARLNAYDNQDFAAENGVVNVLLTSGTFDSASDALFEGDVDVTTAGTGVFDDLTRSVGIGEGSGFEGLFAGPQADEATGSAVLVTSGSDGGQPNGDGLLNFGFITEKQ